VALIRPYIRELRGYFSRLGVRTVEEDASRHGRRLDLGEARKVPFVPRPNLLIGEREERLTDAYMGVLIDRSGSMCGAKIHLARIFGVLLAESARGLPGITGHVGAFDGEAYYDMGGFHRTAIASLDAHGGNNDAGGLSHIARLALRSGKRNKLLVMVSDGLPTECTFEALKSLVTRLTIEHGIVCAQAAVAPIEHVAFDAHIDVSTCSLDTAVTRFGRLLVELTWSWR
jgi:hypothetical protein